MARKRIKGRSRQPSEMSKFLINLEKVNKRLERLNKERMLGKYGSKKVYSAIQSSKKFSITKKSGKLKIKLKPSEKGKIKNSDIRLLNKYFDEFLSESTSTVSGIKRIEQNIKAGIKRTISGDVEISDDDVESFYDMLTDNDFDFFSDKIGSSDVWIIMEEARERNGGANEFVSLLKNYMTVNDKDTAEKAKRLFNKYFRIIS